MDELTRFARILMERLAGRPEGVARPVSVAEVRKTLLPYRAQRKALGLESVEDYDTVLLRLVAEERGYVRTMPATSAALARDELGQPNPDLGVLDSIADSTIQVTSLAAGKVVDDGAPPPAAGSAPPPPPPAPAPATAAPPKASGPTMANSSEARTCKFCSGALPQRRTATFCPHCGERLIPLICARCNSEVETGWKHCITCGAPVSDPYPKS